MRRTELKTKSSLLSKSLLSKGTELKSKTSSLKSGKITGVSRKQKKIKGELSEVYREMDKEIPLCTGCRKSLQTDHSHLIARSKRRDLVSVRENITFHCRTCHEIWEHGTLSELRTLLDFKKNMEYIERADRRHYNLIMLQR